MNPEFFDMLYADSAFCEALGRMTLAAGRFESTLREYLRLRGVIVPDQASFGPLVAALEKHGMLSENGIRILRVHKLQRNYLTHSLFDLYAARINETVLPRTNLVPGDVATFAEKAWELEENLSGLTQIVERAIASIEAAGGISELADSVLFHP
jgi:hypothetical protein